MASWIGPIMNTRLVQVPFRKPVIAFFEVQKVEHDIEIKSLLNDREMR